MAGKRLAHTTAGERSRGTARKDRQHLHARTASPPLHRGWRARRRRRGPRSAPSAQPIDEAAEQAEQPPQLCRFGTAQQRMLLSLQPLLEPAVQRAPAPRQVNPYAPAVARVGPAVNESVGSHPVDQPCQARRGNQRELGDLAHRVTATVGEQKQDPPLLGGAALRLQGAAELTRHRPLGATQRLREILHQRGLARLGHGICRRSMRAIRCECISSVESRRKRM